MTLLPVSYTHLDVYKRQHTYTHSFTCAKRRERVREREHAREEVIFCGKEGKREDKVMFLSVFCKLASSRLPPVTAVYLQQGSKF